MASGFNIYTGSSERLPGTNGVGCPVCKKATYFTLVPTRLGDLWTCCHCQVRFDINGAVEKPDNVQQILNERGSRYGSFVDNSRISQRLKDMWRDEDDNRAKRGAPMLKPHQLEALDMMATKICRIFSGDPNYADNWDDIAGYAQLGKEPR